MQKCNLSWTQNLLLLFFVVKKLHNATQQTEIQISKLWLGVPKYVSGEYMPVTAVYHLSACTYVWPFPVNAKSQKHLGPFWDLAQMTTQRQTEDQGCWNLTDVRPVPVTELPRWNCFKYGTNLHLESIQFNFFIKCQITNLKLGALNRVRSQCYRKVKRDQRSVTMAAWWQCGENSCLTERRFWVWFPDRTKGLCIVSPCHHGFPLGPQQGGTIRNSPEARWLLFNSGHRPVHKVLRRSN